MVLVWRIFCRVYLRVAQRPRVKRDFWVSMAIRSVISNLFPLRRHENIMTVRSVFKDPYSLIINFPRVLNFFKTFFYKLDDLREKSSPYRINCRGKSYFSGGPIIDINTWAKHSEFRRCFHAQYWSDEE